MIPVRAILSAIALLMALTAPAFAEKIVAAKFLGETREYTHGILGDAIEYKTLKITSQAANGTLQARSFQLPKGFVFEDIAPRLWNVDGKPGPEVVVILTDVTKGAALAVYDINGKITQTPHIGRTNRWLAPIGAADFDGDGNVEITYIDRPHLAKTLRLWRFKNNKLRHVVDLKGYTNHRIGERDIAGGIRDCGMATEMVVANADWSKIMAVTFNGKQIAARPLANQTRRKDFTKALRCQ